MPPADDRAFGQHLPRPVKWGPGDIKPKQAVDLCSGITAATTRAFGFLAPTHAAPADCGWVESTLSKQIIQLTVQSNVSVPTAGTTAVQAAHTLIGRLAQADASAEKPAMTPLAGLGDEAVISVKSTTSPSVTFVVPRLNVVATLYATSDSYGLNQKTVSALLQRALRLAAQDVVAEIDRRH